MFHATQLFLHPEIKLAFILAYKTNLAHRYHQFTSSIKVPQLPPHQIQVNISDKYYAML